MNSVVISGSYRKFPEELERDLETFRGLQVIVRSPQSATILSSVEGFVSLAGDLISRLNHVSENSLTNSIRLIEQNHLQAIQQSDALWLVLPSGYVGRATMMEMGYALAQGVPVFYDQKYQADVKEPMVKAFAVPTPGIEYLVAHFEAQPKVDPLVSRLFMGLLVEKSRNATFYNATIAVGPVMADYSSKRYRVGQPRDVLLVRTHKWGGRWSIMGEQLQTGETLDAGLQRVVQEQAGMKGLVREDVCAFDEIPDAGYYRQGTHRIFVDKIVQVGSRKVQLDHRAEEYVWVPPAVAIRDYPLEPNARRTMEALANRNH